jgi:hypothetical protein
VASEPRIARSVPRFLVERRREGQPLVQMTQEAFMRGGSTRKIGKLAMSLRIESLCADALCARESM